MNFIFLLETKVTFFLVWDLQILKLHFGWTFSLAKRLSLSLTHTHNGMENLEGIYV